jgi:hypothetical protein
MKPLRFVFSRPKVLQFSRPKPNFRIALLLIASSFLIPQITAADQHPVLIPEDLHPEVMDIAQNLLSGDAANRAEACMALREFRPVAIKNLLPLFVSMLGDGSPLKISVPYNPFGGIPTSPGQEAAKTLAILGEDALEPLQSALKDQNADKRKSAAAGLGATGNPEAAGALIEQLPLEIHKPVLIAMIEALGHLADPRIGPALLPLLSEPDWDIQKAAAEALVQQPAHDETWIAGLEKTLSTAKQNGFEWTLVDAIETKIARIRSSTATPPDPHTDAH